MSLNDQNFLENLQAADHARKRNILLFGSFGVMVLVVFVWLSVSVFLPNSSDQTTALIRPDFSLWKSLQGGSMLISQNIVAKVGSFGGFFKAEKSYVVTPAVSAASDSQ